MKKYARKLLNFIGGTLEPLLLSREECFSHAPVLLCAPPRSGSTLAYLLIAQAFDTVYFDNLMKVFSTSPCLAQRLKRGLISYSIDLNNRLGETEGLHSPDQGYRTWSRWFPEDRSYVAPDDLLPGSISTMRATINTLQRQSGRPFINKWQRNSARVEALAQAMPEAVFLRITRDPLLVAQSILNVRRTVYGGEANWFSLVPPGYQCEEEKSPYRQIVEQVLYTEAYLDYCFSQQAIAPCHTLDYGELCADPQGELGRIKIWYDAHSPAPINFSSLAVPELSANENITLAVNEREKFEKEIESVRAYLAEKGLNISNDNVSSPFS